MNNILTKKITFLSPSKWILTTIISLVFGSVVLAQEICDNGVDDDNDGLIDLNDDDCECNGIDIYFPSSLFPNPSFEFDTGLCDPPTGPSAVNCAEGWMQPSDATPDYIESCEFMSVILPAPPCPIPDGERCFGFIFSDTDLFDRREYVGTCLTSPLQAGVTYRLTFSMGFLGDTDNQFVSLPFDLTVFGNMDCGSMPFEGVGCPTESNSSSPWSNLGSIFVEGDFEWKQFTMEFTADQNYAAVIIGPPCSDQNAINYYFLDNLILAEKDDFSRDLIYVESGSACEGDLVLAIPELENIDVQWYKDSVAIPGETGFSYAVESGDQGRGSYTVVLSNDLGCSLTLPFDLDYEMPDVEITGPEGLCPGELVEIRSNYTTGNFDWSNGASSPNILVNTAGRYDLRYINEFGCEDRDTIELMEYPSVRYHLEVINESIPGAGDGSVTVVFDEQLTNPQITWIDVVGNGNMISGLSEGEYCVEVEADGRCAMVLCDTVLIDFYPLDLELIADSVSCNGLSDGSVSMEIIGGEEPFDIQWNTSLVNGDLYNLEDLPADIYSVTVTDDAGTVVEGMIEVGQPNALELQLESTDITCFGYGDGSVNVTNLTGGTGDYELTWLDDGSQFPDRIFLEPGTYTLLVEDENGCTIDASETVTEPGELRFDWISGDESCDGASNGFIEITDIQGGTLPYMVNFDGQPVGSQFVFDDLTGNRDYTFAVSDANGCTIVDLVTLDIDFTFTVGIGPDTSILQGQEILLEPSANDEIETLEWYRDDGIDVQCFTCPEISLKPDQTIQVTIYATNEYGCADSDEMRIRVREPFKAYFPNAVSPNGDGVNDEFMIYNADKIELIRSLVIYNQWGQKLFELNDFKPDPSKPLWDIRNNGELPDNDVLVIHANLLFIDGLTSEYKGSLTIIR